MIVPCVAHLYDINTDEQIQLNIEQRNPEVKVETGKGILNNEVCCRMHMMVLKC